MATLTRPGVYVDLSSFPTYANTSPGTAASVLCRALPQGAADTYLRHLVEELHAVLRRV